MAERIVAQVKRCTVCGDKHFGRGFCKKHYVANRETFTDSLYTGHLPMRERIDALTEKIPECGCWLWVGNLNKNGYGRLSVNNKLQLAHRVSYSYFSGKEIPEGLVVCHRCDTPACVNPNHLFLGTHNDNSQDKVSKNRQKRGENGSTLSESQVKAIRFDSRTQRDIAEEYGVSQSQISLIQRGVEWKHLGETDFKRTDKGRIDNGNKVKGAAHPVSKLTDEKVIEIRTKALTNKKYSEKFGVSMVTIQRIQNRQAWAHVP